MKFVYILDPMCAWCYGFHPELEAFLKKHPSFEVDYVMGGLAPDTSEAMDEDLQQTIASYWYEIEKKTSVTFNHSFWKRNTPYRSTYLACRAVIAAEHLQINSAPRMVKAIQTAYYKEAQNPSLKETLLTCASSIGLDSNVFLEVLESIETNQQLQKHFNLTHQFKTRAFPALFYINSKNEIYTLTRGYTKAINLQQQFNEVDNI